MPKYATLHSHHISFAPVLEHGLDITRGPWLSLFQVSRGSHRKKLNLISRYHTHHRAGPRGFTIPSGHSI